MQVSYPVMLFLAFTACNSQTWYETAGLVTSTRNFETERCAGGTEPGCMARIISGSQVTVKINHRNYMPVQKRCFVPKFFSGLHLIILCQESIVDSRKPCACRGTVIGILKAFLGLSASAYITIYVSFLEPDALRFLLLLAIAPTAVALLASPFINYVPFIQIEPHTKVPCARSSWVSRVCPSTRV